jgi:acetyl-CoA carboxylase carboxyltransferase component
VAAQRARRSPDELRERTPADGMVSGFGDVHGQRALAFVYDGTVLGGTQGHNGHRKKNRLLELARQYRTPVVVYAEGGGGRPGETETSYLAGIEEDSFTLFARLSGLVPRVAVVSGRSFAGNAALAGLSDVIIATEGANLGMAGKAMIEAAGIGAVATEDIGPMNVQTANGVVDVLVRDEAEAAEVARRYLGYFQGPIAGWTCADQRRLRHAVPENRLRTYDQRALLKVLADEGSLLELRPTFGVGIVTALARIEGRPVGIMANDPRHLSGAIDGPASDKAARFLQLCDAFGLPVVSVCDTPGFMVGPEAETTATVRRFSRMMTIGANAVVPIVMVVTRKAYGLGAMAMAGGDSRVPVAALSWPTGEFGGMGLEGFVQLAYRAELAAIEDPVARKARYTELVDRMYEQGRALEVAGVFEIDNVIDPADTRREVIAALRLYEPPPGNGRRGLVEPW